MANRTLDEATEVVLNRMAISCEVVSGFLILREAVAAWVHRMPNGIGAERIAEMAEHRRDLLVRPILDQIANERDLRISAQRDAAEAIFFNRLIDALSVEFQDVRS